MVGYTELAAKTVEFILFDAYNNYRTRKLSRQMIAFMRKLSLKPILGSERNVEEFEYNLNLIYEMDFRRLP